MIRVTTRERFGVVGKFVIEALIFEVSEERYQTALESQSNVVVPEREERTVNVSTISATDVTPVLLKPFVMFIVETAMLFTFRAVELSVFANNVLANA